MGSDRSRRQKFAEWIRRYLPCEIAGTIGASVGYYAAAYANAVRWCLSSQRHRPWPSRLLVANLLALRSVAIEFGPGELLDSVLVRPLTFYAAPLLVGNMVIGWIIAKLVSDIAFYGWAIFSYEKFSGLLARRRPHDEEAGDAIAATAAAS